MRGVVIASLLLVSCVSAPATRSTPPSSSAVPGTPRPTVTPLPSSGLPTLSKLPDGTLVVSVPDCLTVRVTGGLSGCELLQSAVDRGVFVAVLRWSDGTLEARSIDLETGVMRGLVPREDFGIVLEDLNGDVAILRETDDLGGGTVHVRLLRIPWRDPTKVEVLDELDVVGVGGGDNWNPWPYARTNGRDVVWLHAGGLFDLHEIDLLTGTTRQVIATTDQPAYFDIDESGRVVLATLTADRTKQDLRFFDGSTLRPLSSRAGDAGGYVASFGDVVGWARGFATVTPAAEMELLPVAGGASRPAKAGNGCLVVGATARDVVTVCSSGARLVDVATGAVRDGPPSHLVFAFRRGLLWATAADLAANPPAWRVTLLAP